jgi:hypothetical protein
VPTTHLLGEVAAIAQALPNERIALQWDVCQEVIAWEGYYEPGPVDFQACEMARGQAFAPLAGRCVPDRHTKAQCFCRSGSGARYGSRPPEDLIRLDHDLVAAIHAGLQQVGRFEHSLIKRNRKFVDSPLEGNGFELPVPREIGSVSAIGRPRRAVPSTKRQ